MLKEDVASGWRGRKNDSGSTHYSEGLLRLKQYTPADPLGI
jgi:hypothetical protein